MKRGYKNLLSVLGAAGLMLPFAGCETDAQEAAEAEGEATNGVGVAAEIATGASTNVAAGATSTNANTTVLTNLETAPATETNVATAANVASGTNTVVSQQTTVVLNRIPPAIPANVKLSKGVEEIVKLAQAGLSETVMLLYVEKYPEQFELDAAEIIYLNDIGIPSTIIAAMLNHDGQGEDVLHDALSSTNAVAATAPPPQTVVTQAPQQQYLVSSNYVAAPGGAGGTVVAQDPYAQQQPVVVEQQPAVVYQQPAVVVQQPAVTYSYFYSSLAPYGSWVEVDGYGWCWQPTIAVTHRAWRPYLHGGRWLHSDVGWYWHSDYSWGWAPFHYGRWHSAPRLGWVWTPDYTWGPSWVTWRRSRDFCGWAPLPPRCDVRPGVGFSYWGRDVGFSFSFGYSHDYYAWVPSRRFCDRRLTDHVVHTDKSVNIYKDSTIVNNYIVGNNNTIVNNGISRDVIRSHTQGELPRVRVAEASGAPGRGVALDRPTRVGTETVVFRPERPSPTLVRAHEQAVARTRGEVARPGGSSAMVGENSIAARTGRPEPVRPTSPATSSVRPGSRQTAEAARTGSGAVPVFQGETVRPQGAARANEGPVFATPAPVRPEPDRSAEILRSRPSRSSQEALVRPNVNSSTSVGGGLVSTRPSGLSGETTTVRPTSPTTSIAPRFRGNPETATSGGRGSAEVVRPATPAASSPAFSSRPSTTTVTREVGRPGITVSPQPNRVETVRPNSPVSRPITTSPNFGQRAAEPARSPDLARPQPQVSRGTPTITQSPSISRPAPTVAQPATPIVRSAPAPQQRVEVSPQPIQRSAPTYQAPAAVRPNVVPRTESFSRPSAPVRSAPAPTVVRPQPAPMRPSVSSPSVSSAPPPARSSPSVSSSSRPIGGGSYQSAPPARAASPSVSRPSSPPPSQSRPSAPSSGSSSGRGRVEVGR